MAAVKKPFEERFPHVLTADGISVFQINLGYRCNLTCRHCHVEAGPERKEIMGDDILFACLDVIGANPIPTIDITGGSPEMHPRIRELVEGCVALGRRVLVRTNGVILLEEDYRALLPFYASRGVEMVISLPHLDGRVTDRQRGEGVFLKIVEVLRRLNGLGYGVKGSGLLLDLAHNPGGAYMPASQASLEASYRKLLRERHAIHFNRLFSLTNMPIGRYLDYLKETDNYGEYMKGLVKAFNPATLGSLMCRTTISVSWDGTLHDCDFNQVLGLPTNHGAPHHIGSFDMEKLAHRRIVVGDHCYGCTAGAGSSCQGEVA